MGDSEVRRERMVGDRRWSRVEEKEKRAEGLKRENGERIGDSEERRGRGGEERRGRGGGEKRGRGGGERRGAGV